jgi:aminoglycoside phosphotransferase (APT) family kinase protein
VSNTPLLASGRDADVYALDEHRVLRRYRAGGDVAAEAEVMRHLAAHGYPVPAVHVAQGSDLVLDRVDGPTMLAALRAGRLRPDEAGRTLAELHTALHVVPGRDPDAPERRILHLDLHPDNVILGARGPVVIDWRNAADGAPVLDVALSAVILAQVVASDDHDLAVPCAVVLAAFLDAAGPVDESALDQAAARRRADPNLTADELDRLEHALALLADQPG